MRPWITRAGLVGALVVGTMGGSDAAEAGATPDPSTGVAEGSSVDWAAQRNFWSFQPPLAQARPDVRRRNWPRERLDYFVLERLEREDLPPADEASRRTLIRRLAYDLTGLPPAPEEVEAFVADSRSDAYERRVELWLASPRFGERLASLWLPLVRYAEDQAHQVGDDTTMAYPNAHLYREWVIDAFNRDLPYDAFLRMQLAADQVEGGTDHLAALGFLGLGPKYYNRQRLEVLADEWEDRVDTVGRAVLGLTVACARCHDHKFDPITMRDYYALAGVFASTRMVNKTAAGEVIDGKVKADQMPAAAMHLVEEGELQDLPIFLRGNVNRKGPVAERGYLRVLGEDAGGPVRFRQGSGRRELAEYLTRRDNPLTARVMVNRLWALFFGQPLVPTASDFGHSGMRPTHAALLDDLAVRFMDNGWSVHRLVREFVNSATYRQSSRARAEGVAADAGNQLLWRMNRRRLTVEQWRDTALAMAGELSWERGRSQELERSDNHRRTVHARISRLKLNDQLMQFDYPDANVHAEKRSVTTTATQKLFYLNSPLVLDAARAFARRLEAEVPFSIEDRIRRGYGLAWGRGPDPDELDWARDFLGRPASAGPTRWEQYAQVLLVANELLYVD